MYFLRQVSHIILAVNEAENEVEINISVPKTHKPSFHGFILLSKKIWKDSLTVKRVPGSIVRKILQRMIRKLGDTIFYGQRDDGKFWGGTKQPSKGSLFKGKWPRGRWKLPKNYRLTKLFDTNYWNVANSAIMFVQICRIYLVSELHEKKNDVTTYSYTYNLGADAQI